MNILLSLDSRVIKKCPNYSFNFDKLINNYGNIFMENKNSVGKKNVFAVFTKKLESI